MSHVCAHLKPQSPTTPGSGNPAARISGSHRQEHPAVHPPPSSASSAAAAAAAASSPAITPVVPVSISGAAGGPGSGSTRHQRPHHRPAQAQAQRQWRQRGPVPHGQNHQPHHHRRHQAVAALQNRNHHRRWERRRQQKLPPETEPTEPQHRHQNQRAQPPPPPRTIPRPQPHPPHAQHHQAGISYAHTPFPSSVPHGGGSASLPPSTTTMSTPPNDDDDPRRRHNHHHAQHPPAPPPSDPHRRPAAAHDWRHPPPTGHGGTHGDDSPPPPAPPPPPPGFTPPRGGGATTTSAKTAAPPRSPPTTMMATMGNGGTATTIVRRDHPPGGGDVRRVDLETMMDRFLTTHGGDDDGGGTDGPAVGRSGGGSTDGRGGGGSVGTDAADDDDDDVDVEPGWARAAMESELRRRRRRGRRRLRRRRRRRRPGDDDGAAGGGREDGVDGGTTSGPLGLGGGGCGGGLFRHRRCGVVVSAPLRMSPSTLDAFAADLVTADVGAMAGGGAGAEAEAERLGDGDDDDDAASAPSCRTQHLLPPLFRRYPTADCGDENGVGDGEGGTMMSFHVDAARTAGDGGGDECEDDDDDDAAYVPLGYEELELERVGPSPSSGFVVGSVETEATGGHGDGDGGGGEEGGDDGAGIVGDDDNDVDGGEEDDRRLPAMYLLEIGDDGDGPASSSTPGAVAGRCGRDVDVTILEDVAAVAVAAAPLDPSHPPGTDDDGGGGGAAGDPSRRRHRHPPPVRVKVKVKVLSYDRLVELVSRAAAKETPDSPNRRQKLRLRPPPPPITSTSTRRHRRYEEFRRVIDAEPCLLTGGGGDDAPASAAGASPPGDDGGGRRAAEMGTQPKPVGVGRGWCSSHRSPPRRGGGGDSVDDRRGHTGDDEDSRSSSSLVAVVTHVSPSDDDDGGGGGDDEDDNGGEGLDDDRRTTMAAAAAEPSPPSRHSSESDDPAARRGSYSGAVVFKFRRFRVRRGGDDLFPFQNGGDGHDGGGEDDDEDEDDPFSSEVSFSRFYIGRPYEVRDVMAGTTPPVVAAERSSAEAPARSLTTAAVIGGDELESERKGKDEEETREMKSAREFLEVALSESRPFVPRNKREQWDRRVPAVLFWVTPYTYLPRTLACWLNRPSIRRSKFDSSLANVLLYVNDGYYTPPNFNCVRSAFFLRGPAHAEVAQWGSHLVGNTLAAKADSRYFASAMAKRGVNLGACEDGAVMPVASRPHLEGLPDAEVIADLCRSVEDGAIREVNYGLPRGCTDNSNGDCVVAGYIRRLLLMLDMERLRSLRDVTEHDMYSVLWEGGIEVPPPTYPHDECCVCNVDGYSEYVRDRYGQIVGRKKPASADGGGTRSGFRCAYHAAQFFVEQRIGRPLPKGKSIVIGSKEHLESFPLVLSLLRPFDKIVARIVVPGVAENWPLVSIGDSIRFRFDAFGIANEVIAEVADVTIKSEVVTVLLPPPLQNGPPSTDVYPYLQTLLRAGQHFVDARPMCENRPLLDLGHMAVEEVRDEHLGRFDVRFGFLGGRGFDIANTVLSSAMGTNTKRRLRGSKLRHLRRVIAPTSSLLKNDSGLMQSQKIPILDWATSVNDEQKAAVCDIVHRNHGDVPYIVFGPAGTGKTLTIIEAVIQVLRSNPHAKILLCAPSDAACDVLAKRLLPKLGAVDAGNGPTRRMLRINWWARKAASLPPELLPCTPMSDGGFFDIPDQTKIKQAGVVVCQCFVAGCLELDATQGFMKSHFTHVFIDETSQAMECEVLVPILKVGNMCSVVLAGDPKQLSPTVRDPVASCMGLSVSLQERLMQLPLYSFKHHHNQSSPSRVITRLTGNYRSHNALLTVPSTLFYGGSLRCLAPDDVTSPYADWGELGPATRFPLMLYDVGHGKERNKIDTPSFYNLEECCAIIKLIRGLLDSPKIRDAGGISTDALAVITPFRAQVLVLRAKLRLSGLGSVNVGVVEDYQGQEKKIVFISTVLTRPHARWNRGGDAPPVGGINGAAKNGGGEGGGGPPSKLGFMHDPKRFNVAITRAHALCVVVGHAEYLEASGTYWTALIEHIRRNDGIVGSKIQEGSSQHPQNGVIGEEMKGGSDKSGIAKLIERVEELKLLGGGYRDDKHDLAVYYEDSPQWKVMLT